MKKPFYKLKSFIPGLNIMMMIIISFLFAGSILVWVIFFLNSLFKGFEIEGLTFFILAVLTSGLSFCILFLKDHLNRIIIKESFLTTCDLKINDVFFDKEFKLKFFPGTMIFSIGDIKIIRGYIEKAPIDKDCVFIEILAGSKILVFDLQNGSHKQFVFAVLRVLGINEAKHISSFFFPYRIKRDDGMTIYEKE